MRNKFIKAFTLVEMLVALAVSSIIIGATYSSYQMVATQYKKNMDVADMHTSGRAIMRIIERDIRMAGFEYRDKDAKVTYGTISNPLEIKDSGNKCCDEVTVIYDYYDEEVKKAERIRIRYWAENYSSNKGSRYRLYKQKDILGRNKQLLVKPILGNKDVMADYIEDLQISDAGSVLTSSSCDYSKVCAVYNGLKIHAEEVKKAQQDRLKKDPTSSLISRNYVRILNWRDRVEVDVLSRSRAGKGCSDSGFWVQKYWKPPNDRSSRLSIDDFSAGSCTGVNSCFERKNYWVSKVNPMCLFGDGTSNGNGFKLKPNNCNNEQYYISATPKLSLKLLSNGKWNEFTCPDVATPSLLNMSLTLRTKNQYGKDRQFKKKDYHGGNYKIDKTDKYKRDTFSSTVLVRNLAL